MKFCDGAVGAQSPNVTQSCVELAQDVQYSWLTWGPNWNGGGRLAAGLSVPEFAGVQTLRLADWPGPPGREIDGIFGYIPDMFSEQ